MIGLPNFRFRLKTRPLTTQSFFNYLKYRLRPNFRSPLWFKVTSLKDKLGSWIIPSLKCELKDQTISNCVSWVWTVIYWLKFEFYCNMVFNLIQWSNNFLENKIFHLIRQITSLLRFAYICILAHDNWTFEKKCYKPTSKNWIDYRRGIQLLKLWRKNHPFKFL